MANFLGLDTSNYTTSAAIYHSDTQTVSQAKKLLPVKAGQKGLRQSDAVFHHTVQLPEVLAQLETEHLTAIGVSVKPRNTEDSYMPCFLCGAGTAQMLGQALHIPVYQTSHQTGHILAALHSAGKLDWLKREFFAFHVSGGTTDCVLCRPVQNETLFDIQPVSSSLDLKAGQLIDRVGLMLGLQFPCGAELETLAMQSRKHFQYKPVMKELNCYLSGLENQCAKMLQQTEYQPCDIALFCLTAIANVLEQMTAAAFKTTSAIPVLYAGGVMADQYIQNHLKQSVKAETAFAEPVFSCDNAAGTAIYAYLHTCADNC
ncbi:MAG: peptidase M22 [Oscillospiraceae bacterium]|nr:peptidase M22 [Oscillospiraceae bacterium]